LPPAGDYVVPDGLEAARSDAEANGWVLTEIEQPDAASPGTVLAQSPAPGTAMVRGSALLIRVAIAPAEPEE
jgi:beta-lactam-binding protein with PASTA domain